MEGEETMKKGVFYSVGVGPGDPELITLKAVRTLERCPVVAAPQTKNGEMLALSIARQTASLEDKIIVPLHFTMSRDKAQQHAAHLAAARALRVHLDAGQDVAMLNLGDVSIPLRVETPMRRSSGEELVAIRLTADLEEVRDAVQEIFNQTEVSGDE